MSLTHKTWHSQNTRHSVSSCPNGDVCIGPFPYKQHTAYFDDMHNEKREIGLISIAWFSVETT